MLQCSMNLLTYSILASASAIVRPICIGYVQNMTSLRLANLFPILAVLGSVTALGIGTSFAK